MNTTPRLLRGSYNNSITLRRCSNSCIICICTFLPSEISLAAPAQLFPSYSLCTYNLPPPQWHKIYHPICFETLSNTTSLLPELPSHCVSPTRSFSSPSTQNSFPYFLWIFYKILQFCGQCPPPTRTTPPKPNE